MSGASANSFILLYTEIASTTAFCWISGILMRNGIPKHGPDCNQKKGMKSTTHRPAKTQGASFRAIRRKKG
jgi:hypothetical protein